MGVIILRCGAMNVTLHCTAVLLLAMSCGAHGSSSTTRLTGQGCERGSACLLLARCPELQAELQALLRHLTVSRLDRLRSLTCGFEKRRAKVCCPSTAGTVPLHSVPTSKPTLLAASEALLPSSCGHAVSREKIHGGTPVPLGAYPWMAVLGFTRSGDRLATSIHWGCGGSLITEQHVLTAAQCTVPTMTNFFDLTVVRLGEHNLVKNPDCSSSFCAPEPLDFGISSVIRHPSFNTRGALSDDVAVLKLDKTVDFSSLYIQPICLPSPGMSAKTIIQGRDVFVIGFGDTEAGVRSNQLLEVLLPYVPMQQCRMVANYSSLAANGQVCLGGKFQMDSCFKDSGGPAMVTTTPTSSQYLQVGIVSYGTQSCGVENVPAIYTDVAYYRNWIVSQLSA
ncbi:phenoloxidase-activating factor 3 [Hyalella azteca]|uniref:Phenoloxidase-activating factor 3 n=1 Tax=Hyalella azteca TaxID=294128 RepID=A0A8B7PGT8_HYAAZ|nr:phenoloxidase-activating factor 3 [Hyalella azteca]